MLPYQANMGKVSQLKNFRGLQANSMILQFLQYFLFLPRALGKENFGDMLRSFSFILNENSLELVLMEAT